MAVALGPQDLNSIYELLQHALNQDPAVRAPAEDALNSLALRVGFCSCLTEIIANRSGQHEVRWLATVYFKNSIARYWRVRRESEGITNEEKEYLRSKVLELIYEDSKQIGIQMAVLIAKIARHDYPKLWPSLFPSLMSGLAASSSSSDPPSSPPARAASSSSRGGIEVYLVLHHIIKELASKRLASDQAAFHQVTVLLFPTLWGQWSQDTGALLQGLQHLAGGGTSGECLDSSGLSSGGLSSTSSGFSVVCERWRYCLKLLRRLLCFGYQGDAKSLQDIEAVPVMLPAFLAALNQLLPFWSVMRGKAGLHAVVEGGIIKLIKTTIDIQTTHPWSCRHPEVYPAWLEFTFNQVCIQAEAEGGGEGGMFTPLLIQCMLFLQNSLKFLQSNSTALASGAVLNDTSSSSTDASLKAARLAALRPEMQGLLTGFFNPERVMRLCHTAVFRYFPLRREDLQAWAEDPEGFYHEQDTLSYQDSLRPCAETLFLTALQAHRQLLAPKLVEWLQQIQSSPPWTVSHMPALASSPPFSPPGELLTKEAVYNALGLGSYELHDHLDFQAWFSTHLHPELQDRSAGSLVLRRRAAWALGCWVARISEDIRPPAYSLLIGQLEDGDLCAQLAAVNGLRGLVEDWGFYEDHFLPFAGACFQRLFAALERCVELDSQLQIFNLIHTLVDRLAEKVAPYSPSILAAVPVVWQGAAGMEAGGQSLLRVQLLQVLVELVKAIGCEASGMLTTLLPLLQYCTDPDQSEAVSLLEDALALWDRTLKHLPGSFPPTHHNESENFGPALLPLFPHLTKIMERSTEHVQVCLGLISSHVLLLGAPFMQAYGQVVGGIVGSLFGALGDRGTLLLFPVLNTILKCFPAEGPALLEPTLLSMLKFIFSGKESNMVVAAGYGVMARLLLVNPQLFSHILMAGIPPSPEGDSPLARFIDGWLDACDSVPTSTARKLSGIALTTLLTTGAQEVLSRLEGILSVTTQVVLELEGDPGGDAPDGFEYWVTRGAEDDGLASASSGECLRLQQVSALDPASQITLSKMLSEKLNECHTVYGQQNFQAALASVSPSTLSHLQKCCGMSGGAAS